MTDQFDLELEQLKQGKRGPFTKEDLDRFRSLGIDMTPLQLLEDKGYCKTHNRLWVPPSA